MSGIFYVGFTYRGRRFEDLGRFYLDNPIYLETEVLEGFLFHLGIFLANGREVSDEYRALGYRELHPHFKWEAKDKEWVKFLDGFRSMGKEDLFKLKVYLWDVDAPRVPNRQHLPPPARFWHPPKEKAAACRALAKACRAWEPGVDMIWKNIEEEIRSGDPELFDKKVGRCLSVTTDRQRAAGCIDGDLPSHLGANLESLATLMDLATAAGETEVCFLFDS